MSFHYKGLFLLALASVATMTVSAQGANVIGVIEGQCRDTQACKDYVSEVSACLETVQGDEVPAECLCQDSVLNTISACGSCIFADPVQSESDRSDFSEIAESVPEVCGGKRVDYQAGNSTSTTGGATTLSTPISGATSQTSAIVSSSSAHSTSAKATTNQNATADATAPPAQTSLPGAAHAKVVSAARLFLGGVFATLTTFLV
ncbi:hypothetical protein OIV83_001386 [Microbotryomycetes sp. JL201]|nr:hypothetical protein OIV83_001386 [Microbotryomycetes sp. JL201]